jgi:tripartite motif-containing protein 71
MRGGQAVGRYASVVSAAALAVPFVYADFVYRGEWGSFGAGPGQFDRPYGVAVADDGLVYVTDFNNHRVQYFSATGNYLGEWGSEGKGKGQFCCPWGVAAHGRRIYVTDTLNHRVQYFTRAGSFLGAWGEPGTG